MFRIFLCLTLFSIPFILSESCNADVPSDQLIEAIETVESKGDVFAVGDTHLSDKAYGCLQIRQPCLDDYNKWHRTSYIAEDMLGNRELSIKICIAYINHYAIERRVGRKPTYEDMARIWNGGPNGYKKSSTKKYWEKVKRTLNKQFKVSFNKKIGVNLPPVFFIAQNLYFWYHFAIASVVQW